MVRLSCQFSRIATRTLSSTFRRRFSVAMVGAGAAFSVASATCESSCLATGASSSVQQYSALQFPELSYSSDHFMVREDAAVWVVHSSPPITYEGVRYRVVVIVNPTDSRYRLICSAKGVDDPSALFNLPQDSPLFVHAMSSIYQAVGRVYTAAPKLGCVVQVMHIGKMALVGHADAIQIGNDHEPYIPHVHVLLRSTQGHCAFPGHPYQGPAIREDFALATGKQRWNHNISHCELAPARSIAQLVLPSVSEAGESYGESGFKVITFDPRIHNMRETLAAYFE